MRRFWAWLVRGRPVWPILALMLCAWGFQSVLLTYPEYLFDLDLRYAMWQSTLFGLLGLRWLQCICTPNRVPTWPQRITFWVLAATAFASFGRTPWRTPLEVAFQSSLHQLTPTPPVPLPAQLGWYRITQRRCLPDGTVVLATRVDRDPQSGNDLRLWGFVWCPHDTLQVDTLRRQLAFPYTYPCIQHLYEGWYVIFDGYESTKLGWS